jgi:heme/copper-type cytochrome/quinol oxidase subunit 2
MFPKNMSEAWKTTLIILSIVIPVIAVLIILLVWYKRTNDKATEN